MLSIVICSQEEDTIKELKGIIQDFLIDKKLMAKVAIYNNPDEILTAPSRFDAYFLDMNAFDIINVIPYSRQIKEIDDNGHIIYFSQNAEWAIVSAKAKADYYFTTDPIDQEEVFDILKEIRKEVKEDSIVIPIPGGQRRIRANHLNYINIVKRCLCYHLKDGAMFDGQTLRTSFDKAIYPLQENPQFLFLPPSLLINLNEIKILMNDKIIFENDDVLYFPKKAHDTIHSAWEKYNRIL